MYDVVTNSIIAKKERKLNEIRKIESKYVQVQGTSTIGRNSTLSFLKAQMIASRININMVSLAVNAFKNGRHPTFPESQLFITPF